MHRGFTVAQCAIIHICNLGVIHISWTHRPIIRTVAGIAVLSEGGYVRAGLTPGDDIVVATAATAVDLTVVHLY